MADEPDPGHKRRMAGWRASTDRIHAQLRALPVEERRAFLCPPVVARKRPERTLRALQGAEGKRLLYEAAKAAE